MLDVKGMRMANTDSVQSGAGWSVRHPGEPVYLVLERDALISADLIGAIEARGPCPVLHVTSPDEARAALDGAHAPRAAFLEMRIDEALNSTLAADLARHGAQLVLTLGEDVDRVMAEGWSLPLRPFTERMVHETLGTG